MQKSVKFENKCLKDERYCKVRDPGHCVGEDRGPAHSKCNLKYSAPKKIHIFFKMDLTMIITLPKKS